MEENYLIKKWLTGTLSENEWEEFKKLDDYELHLKLDEKAKYFKAEEFLNPADFDILKERITSRPKPQHKFNAYKTLMRFAALLVIAIGVYFAFNSTDLTEVNTGAGEKTTVFLPDASEVLLNAMTEIEFNEKKWDNKREIKLSGEAYFIVAKGEAFDVLTSEGKVSVLGTKFNVKSRDGLFEVVCNEGSVGIEYQGEYEKLLPGQYLHVYDGEIAIDKIPNAKPLWLKNISNFNEVPFSEVLQELERQYGIKVEANKVDLNHIFKGGFTHDNLNKALESITLPMGLTYVIKSPKLVVLKYSE